MIAPGLLSNRDHSKAQQSIKSHTRIQCTIHDLIYGKIYHIETVVHNCVVVFMIENL